MAKTETALVLPEDAVAGSDAVHFSEFPGTWTPGTPVAVAALGFPDEQAALARVEELGLPLTVVDVKPGSARPPGAANHAPNDAEVAAGAEQWLGTADVFPPDAEPLQEAEPAPSEAAATPEPPKTDEASA